MGDCIGHCDRGYFGAYQEFRQWFIWTFSLRQNESLSGSSGGAAWASRRSSKIMALISQSLAMNVIFRGQFREILAK